MGSAEIMKTSNDINNLRAKKANYNAGASWKLTLKKDNKFICVECP